MSDDPALARLLSRRTMIAGGLLTGTGLLANSRRPDKPLRMVKDAKIDPLIPNKVGKWNYVASSGLVMPPADQMRDELYNAVLTRYYAAPDDLPIMLLVAYNGTQDGMLQVHRPEVCYPAAGYDLVEQRVIPLKVDTNLTVPGHYISAKNASRHEQLMYWTRIGNDFPTRWWSQHWAVAKENLKGNVPDGVLVRISTAAPDDKTAIAALLRFIPALVDTLSPTGRRLLFGEAGAPFPAK